MIAQIVPIIRLRRDTTWWSYTIPTNLSVLPGSLVVIPFRGRACLGIVWHVEEYDSKAKEAITAVLSKRPLVTSPHRSLIEYLSREGLCSLSTALFTWLPGELRTLPFTKKTRELVSIFSKTTPESTRKQHAILVPGLRPLQESFLQKKFTLKFASLFSNSSLETWMQIANGTIQVGMGREGALFAPWSNLRHITVIEPEDIAFYHEQTPYLSLVSAAQVLAEVGNAEFEIKSWLPQNILPLLGFTGDGSVLQVTPTIRDIRRESIINPDLLADITSTLRQHKKVLLLLNAHDRIVTTPDSDKKSIPGIETLRKRLAHQLGMEELNSNILLGTRSILSTDLEGVGLCVSLLADTALGASNFADTLHGIADLCHLASLPCPFVIQTYDPGNSLIQAFANNSVSAYLETRISEQREAHLPPFGSQIACSYPGNDPQLAQALYEQLTPLISEPWQLSYPFQTTWRKKQFTTLVLQAEQYPRLSIQVRKLLVQLPRPWRVQRSPWHLA